MVALPLALPPSPRPYAAEILETDQALEQVQAQIWGLAQVYRAQACQRILTYVMERVRHTCTQDYPGDFLGLAAEAQWRVMSEAQTLALELRDQLQRVDLEAERDPWLTLEAAIAPHLEATQQLLDQLYQQVQIGRQAPGSTGSLTPLNWLEMEMADPQLKGLRAHLQVSAARWARLQRQRQQWERKQQIAEAEARWVELQATGQSREEGVTMTSGSDG